jgi:hypothetical protein
MCSTWQKRRMVIGHDMIYFTFLGDDAIVDCIPLAEILVVKKMGSDSSADQPQHTKSILGDQHLSSNIFIRALRIETSPEGYNSGRTYHIQVSSDSEFSRLATSLVAYMQDAKKRFEAKTGLEKSQANVRRVFHSRVFQCTAAFFILLVNILFMNRPSW